MSRLSRTLAVLMTALLAPVAVHAQTNVAATTPIVAPTVDTSPYALHYNPANLTYAQGFSQAFTLTSSFDNDEITDYGTQLVFGDGHVGGGLGYDHFSGPNAYSVITTGFAVGSPHLSLGWSRHYANSRLDRDLDRFATSAIALTARASRFVALSAMVTNVGTPWLGDAVVNRGYQMGLGVRSARGEVELDLFASVPERPDTAGDGTAGATLITRPIRGASLFATTRVESRNGEVELLDIRGGVDISVGAETSTLSARADGEGNLVDSTIAIAMSYPYAPQLLTPRRSLWRIDLVGEVSEFGDSSLMGNGSLGINDLVFNLRRLATEDLMAGVYLHLDHFQAGPAQLHELRTALAEVQDAGKLVVIYATDVSLTELYLAGAADYLYAPPTTTLFETGIALSASYLADLLENLGIEAQFVRIGDYKSAPERYLENGPTEASRERHERYVEVVWQAYLDGITPGQEVDLEALLAAPPLGGSDLIEAGLVDGLIYEDEFTDTLEDDTGEAYLFSPVYGRQERNPSWLPRTEIAVLHIDGVIVSGQSTYSPFFGGSQVGDASIIELADALREDRSVDGVILRVNSPGGSAFASDEMHRALTRLAEEKPVVVSMGDVAGSGGYYVSAIGAPIVASPTTLTGSIGIYTGTFAFDTLYDVLGVHPHRFPEGARAHYFDGLRWDEDDVAVMQATIEQGYELFVDRVAEGRGMTPEEVDAVGQGRIWTGTDAIEVGLVDHLGGFNDALDLLCTENALRCDWGVELAHYGEPAGGLFMSIGVARTEPSSVMTQVISRLGLAPYLTELDLWLASEPGETLAFTEGIPLP